MVKKATKAALLSGFIFPGAGHLWLRIPIIGIALSGVSIFALYSLISTALTRAHVIVEKIQMGEVQPDIATITNLVSIQMTAADTQSVGLATTVLVIAWLFGIVTAYWSGRKIDRNTAA